MEAELLFHIVLEHPPAGVDFGLQKGKGNFYETIQKQRSAGKHLYFEFTAGIKKAKDGAPDFTGQVVQGPAGGRFIYINIGASAGQFNSEYNRRLKIPLYTITWNAIHQTTAKPDQLLETNVPGTAKDGSPTCATVKPFNGWKTAKSKSKTT